MINIFFAAVLIGVVLWAAKKFYFATEMADHPELYPARPEGKASKKDLRIVAANLQRWRQEGKISREEYDHLTDLYLAEMQALSKTEKGGTPHV